MAEAGRKPFKPSKSQRSDVALFVADGVSEAGIARHLGICVNTLRKHFEVELLEGAEIAVTENLALLRKSAKDGNVSAQKHLDGRVSRAAAAKSFDAPTPTKELSRSGPKLGKKEQAQAEALTAGQGTDWEGDLDTPPTVIAKANGPLN